MQTATARVTDRHPVIIGARQLDAQIDPIQLSNTMIAYLPTTTSRKQQLSKLLSLASVLLPAYAECTVQERLYDAVMLA